MITSTYAPGQAVDIIERGEACSMLHTGVVESVAPDSVTVTYRAYPGITVRRIITVAMAEDGRAEVRPAEYPW